YLKTTYEDTTRHDERDENRTRRDESWIGKENGQERMEQVQEEMKDLIRVRKDMRAHVESQVEGIKDHVNGCIGRIEEEVQGVKLKIEEGEIHMKIEEVKSEVQEKMSDLERRINDLETQFDVVSSTNRWTNFEKTSKLVTSLRGSAAEVLQGIPADKLMDLTTMENALESRFGASHLTQFYRTELKTRRQRPRESLRVLSSAVERLMSKCRGKRSECLIQGVLEVSGQFKYAVTDFSSQVSPKGILVVATLVDLERKAILVRVLNLKNKPKILDKGAVTATYELVVDIVVRPQEFSGAQHLL
ncbi:hypothetical protein AVEN_223575-1, partial [Araneus ventricosus]